MVVANNYSLHDAMAHWRSGAAPVSHLWGAAALEEAGHSLRYFSPAPSPVGDRLSASARDRLGDVALQARVRRSVRQGVDLLYAADPRSLAGLSLGRSLGMARTPMMCAVHPNAWRGVGKRRSLLGYDEVITLSSKVRDELVDEVGRNPDRTTRLPWGPDLDFVGYASTGDDVVVSSGKTERDVTTLLAALDQAGVRGRVHSQVALPHYAGHSEIVVRAPYSEVLADLQRASIVAIPLSSAEQGWGITELNDALALAKPVLITRNPYIDVDVERIGCGRWLPPGDVGAWTSALRDLSGDADTRRQMGALGREYAEASHNARLFGEGVLALATRVLERL